MMLWPARASRAACEADEDPDAPAAGTAAALPGLARLAEPAEPCEQPESSKAAPDISPAHVSAVMRSGPREARARTVVFMPLGRARRVPGSAGPGHGPATDLPGYAGGCGDQAAGSP